MKNVSMLKPSKTDSPKTPGGISRSLLTPCRRLGLSRNFRKSGPSPFQSPLSSKTDIKQEKVETRKRKESLEDCGYDNDSYDCGTNSEDQNVQTPSRKVELPRRKKSKTLLTTINKSPEENEPSQEKVTEIFENNTNSSTCECTDTENIHSKISKDILSKCTDLVITQSVKEIVTPLRLKSNSRIKKNIVLCNSISKQLSTNIEKQNISNEATSVTRQENEQSKGNSPNNLTKECIVVIQKKIFKKELKETSPSLIEKLKASPPKSKEIASQPVFDSDSDDVPLICLNQYTDCKQTELNTIDEDDPDFASNTKLSKPIKTKSKTKLKSPVPKKKNSSKVVEAEVYKVPNSQNSDDDDDFCEKKKTILIRKSYDKVTKPNKAKSTGSITQKDIDDLKARIETKKKMLLARAMTEDTKELRDLIKKWQKGCQDALMELMDLMKSKFSDKQNMDYSEILQTLKIPSSLVGYDSDNECFLTPDDKSIILAKV